MQLFTKLMEHLGLADHDFTPAFIIYLLTQYRDTLISLPTRDFRALYHESGVLLSDRELANIEMDDNRRDERHTLWVNHFFDSARELANNRENGAVTVGDEHN